MTDDAEYGPRGYLPQRAAKRARKIILREQMGTPWVMAAIVAAVVVLAAGAWYLVTSNRAPSVPYQPIGAISDVPALGAMTFLIGEEAPTGYLVSRAGGEVRVFLAPAEPPVQWCLRSRRYESSDGAVWTVDGALVGGDGESLRPVPTKLYGGQVYVDSTSPSPAPTADPRGEKPECA